MKVVGCINEGVVWVTLPFILNAAVIPVVAEAVVVDVITLMLLEAEIAAPPPTPDEFQRAILWTWPGSVTVTVIDAFGRSDRMRVRISPPTEEPTVLDVNPEPAPANPKTRPAPTGRVIVLWAA